MFKKLLTLSLATALMLTGIIAVGAQDDPTPPDPATSDQARPFFDGRDGRGPRLGNRIDRLNIDAQEIRALVETYTGLSQDELRDAMRDGATLRELIEANGASVEDFMSEAAAPAFQRIDEAVAEGNLTEEQAAELQTRVTDRLTNMLENGRLPNMRRGNGPIADILDTDLIQTYTGLPAAEALSAIRDGATMAELIEANGASVDAFVAEAVTLGETAIDERAAQRKANLEDTIRALVNGERPQPMPPIAAGQDQG
jgi:hypothetical protein